MCQARWLWCWNCCCIAVMCQTLGWLWPFLSGSSTVGNLLGGLLAVLGFWMFFLACSPKSEWLHAHCVAKLGDVPQHHRVQPLQSPQHGQMWSGKWVGS